MCVQQLLSNKSGQYENTQWWFFIGYISVLFSISPLQGTAIVSQQYPTAKWSNERYKHTSPEWQFHDNIETN